MARVKGALNARKRHKKVLKLAIKQQEKILPEIR